MGWPIAIGVGFAAVLFAGGVAYFLTGWFGRTILAPPAPPWTPYLASWLLLTTMYGRLGPAVFAVFGGIIAALHGLVWLDRRRRGVRVDEVPPGERAR